MVRGVKSKVAAWLEFDPKLFLALLAKNLELIAASAKMPMAAINPPS